MSKTQRIIIGGIFVVSLIEGFVYSLFVVSLNFLNLKGPLWKLLIDIQPFTGGLFITTLPIFSILLPFKNIVSVVLILKRKFVLTNIFSVLISISNWHLWATIIMFFRFRFLVKIMEIIMNPATGFLVIIFSILLIYFYHKELKKQKMESAVLEKIN